jgi:hypothetical protein
MTARVISAFLVLVVLWAVVASATAKEDVDLVYSGRCGASGRKVYIRNTGERPIKATVEVRDYSVWNDRTPRYRKFVVDPGEMVYVGCTDPGDLFTRHHSYSFKVTGAYYVN